MADESNWRNLGWFALQIGRVRRTRGKPNQWVSMADMWSWRCQGQGGAGPYGGPMLECHWATRAPVRPGSSAIASIMSRGSSLEGGMCLHDGRAPVQKLCRSHRKSNGPCAVGLRSPAGHHACKVDYMEHMTTSVGLRSDLSAVQSYQGHRSSWLSMYSGRIHAVNAVRYHR